MSPGIKNKKPKALHIGLTFNPHETGRGGVILYQWELMKTLQQSGWDISFFTSSKHTLSRKITTNICRIDGIKVIELVNSPRRHGDFACNPLDHLQNKIIDDITERILAQEAPDLIHIHDPRLFTASIVDVCRNNGIPAVKTIHNYFDVCPQGELMYKGETLCIDYNEGSSCIECLSYLPEESFLKERLSDSLRGSLIHPILKKLWNFSKDTIKTKQIQSNPSRTRYPSNSYRARREFFVKRLQMLEAIHCSSQRAAEILMGYGVSKEKIIHIPITSRSIDMIKPKPASRVHYPIIFGYLAGESHIKGFEILMTAFSRLDQSKAKLIAYGFQNVQDVRKEYKHLNVEFHNPYHLNELSGILSELDVGLMPSKWEEVFGLIGLEFQAARVPVIGSDIGGITEWLKNEENGLLAKAGDSKDLASKMEMFLNNPALISRMQATIKTWKSMDVHAQEILDMYKQVAGIGK